MKNARKDSIDVDTIRFAILMQAGLWMQENKLEDMTQIEDEYILRQLAKFRCFSLHDVIRELDKLAKRLNIDNPLKPNK